jgi:segregation and condensation protein A
MGDSMKAIENNMENRKISEEHLENYLLFHKAIIGDDEDGKRINEYMEIVKGLKGNTGVSIKDPFDRYIAITFELIIDHQLNPWNVDLVKFSSEYLKRIKEEKNIDLVTAGYILYMAWSILKMQTDEVLSKIQQSEQDNSLDSNDPGWLANTTDEEFDFTTRVLNSDASPIQEMVWRKGKRPVTLMELTGAFEEARKDVELHRISEEKRKELVLKNKLLGKEYVQGMLHKESIEDDMSVTWSRICKFNGHPIPLSHLYTPDQEDKITVFVSSLYLAYYRFGMINMWQNEFPYGEIFIKNIAETGKMGKIT